jgi:hypothetical protein
MNEARKAVKRRECEEGRGHDWEVAAPSILGDKPYPTVVCKRCGARKVFDILTQLKAMYCQARFALQETGGCDHSVGLCTCNEAAELDDAATALVASSVDPDALFKERYS